MASRLPNHLTLARIAAIVPLAVLIVTPGVWAAWLAFLLYLAAALTDWLDGYLARKLGSVSAVGKFLDPIADKMLVAAVLIMLVADHRLIDWNLIPVLLILGRELLVSGLREYLGQKAVALPVSQLAKWKTGLQMTAQGAIILAPGLPALGFVNGVGILLLWAATLLTVITGGDYLRRAIRYLRAA
ncbi:MULTISPECIES: CDP-diacylglycerol--glycerol-3-phosphate 3-phosphatidyltransferase [Limibacillus]|jgi:cardiolipin synthase|uniref:CDP-diacylglycerol--glycerol-3-phosphate 3-phosphatidyltransferase n=1 Tax=Limibacillus halophilus TaxID=1579333 RepID=A0A839SUG9_9PROT|nr:CDP-diacylglycerol--glycerol-3-phosphate 3-phosphatidyltransferase [Limibacillus halophilus]MBB3065340.1 cardiolipin synthase [Limibacillus halophilus]